MFVFPFRLMLTLAKVFYPKNVGGARDQERSGEAAAGVDREEDEAEPGARKSGRTGDHPCGSISLPGKQFNLGTCDLRNNKNT